MKTIYALLSKIKFLLLFFFLIAFACNNSKKIEDKVIEFQASIDSILKNVVVPMKIAIDTAVYTYNTEGKDTFQLARQRIPITKVQFLISNEYFILDEYLVAYSQNKINETELSRQLKQSQLKVDSLINYDLKNIKNYTTDDD
jgi:hypothetical protein